MGDITLNDIKVLIDDLKKELKQEIEKSNNKISTLETNLKNEIEKSNKELKQEIEDSNKELKKEIKNNSYKIEMLQSKNNKPNNFLDALSPATAVGSKYHKTNSFYSE